MGGFRLGRWFGLEIRIDYSWLIVFTLVLWTFSAGVFPVRIPGLGGEVMQRAGFEVCLAADLEGSYEEGPPDLLAYAKRERRWCQGNLQHFWLLFADKLRLTSKVHFSFGYFSSFCIEPYR